MRLKLDLHEMYNKTRDLDRALHDVIDEAEATRAKTVEIIPGKGSGLTPFFRSVCYVSP